MFLMLCCGWKNKNKYMGAEKMTKAGIINKFPTDYNINKKEWPYNAIHYYGYTTNTRRFASPIPSSEEDFDVTFDEFREWMKHTGGTGYSTEVSKLFFDCAKDGNGEGYIVETGMWEGFSASWFAAGSKTAGRELVISVDNYFCRDIWPFVHNDLIHYGKCDSRLFFLGVFDWVRRLGFHSAEAAEMLNSPVRILYVDDDHGYEACSASIFAWTPLLISGGTIFVDDYHPEIENDTVVKAVNEHIRDSKLYKDFYIIDDSHVVMATKI